MIQIPIPIRGIFMGRFDLGICSISFFELRMFLVRKDAKAQSFVFVLLLLGGAFCVVYLPYLDLLPDIVAG